MSDEEKRGPGRPSGRAWSYKTSLYLPEEEARLLERLAKKLDRSHNWTMREALRELAKREGVE